MKLVVAVKQTARLDDDFELDEDTGRVDADSVEWELNEWDGFAIEAALQLRDAGGVGEVVAVTVGGASADEALLDALARGADRAIRIEPGEADDLDPLGTARLLAAAVAPEQPDLVLCGAQSSDAVNGATGTALAAHLGLPRVAVVRDIALDGDRLTVDRELEGGLVEVVRVPMPAVVTVQTGINEPRYATLRAIKQARDKPLEVREPADLGLDEAALDDARGATLVAVAHPQGGARAEMLTGSSDEVAAQIARILKDRLGR